MHCILKLTALPSGSVSCSHENRLGSNCSFTCQNSYSITGSVHRQRDAEEGEPPAYCTGNETHCESKPVMYLLRKYHYQSINRSIIQLVSHQPTNQLTANQPSISRPHEPVCR